MRLRRSGAEVWAPDGAPAEKALGRTTHLGVCAHPDDLEILAFPGIMECFQREDRWFTGVLVTDGAGSPRVGPYADYTDAAMRDVRRREQKKAAQVGEYGALVLLDYASADVKDPRQGAIVEDLVSLLRAAKPEVVYTHNPADRHDTHVATALRTIVALRELGPRDRPRRVLGGEVWRDLDWLAEGDKVVQDVSSRENLAAALLGVFDSQIGGGKRYDLATLGRRRAHATYAAPRSADAKAQISLAMDLTPLVADASRDVAAYVQAHIDRFAEDVRERIERLC